jgi:lambda family phage portal protein
MPTYEIINGKWHHAPARRTAPARIRHRAFAGAQQDRLTASFTGSSLSPDEALRRDLRKLRQRSRQLCMDNDYAKKFLHMVGSNVVGARGIKLQAAVLNEHGEQDNHDNQILEDYWHDFCLPENCTVTGRLSFRDVLRVFITTVARDGEILVRFIDRPNSRYGVQLQLIEVDHLDENYNKILSNGNRIVMGVEVDALDAPVAYHLFTRHPGENAYLWGGKHYQRIPANEIIHAFVMDRPGQNRGVPWLHTAIRRLNMLGGYEEAELVAARIGASKMGFYTSADGATHATVDDMAATGDEYDDRELIEEAEPGVFHELPEGVGFTAFDPQHPTAAFADFTKAVLRGAASGLNVAYNTLANDLEGVNFSSIRSGVLEEREQWRQLQQWVIEQFCARVYRRWINLAIAHKKVRLPQNKLEKYHRVTWQPRGWDWVDPLKDAKANADSIAMGVTTRAEVAAAKGRDLRDIFEQLQREQNMAAEYGLTLTTANKSNLTGENADEPGQD